MKKFFISIALAAFSVFANAQVIIPVDKGEGLVRKSNEKIVINNTANSNRATSLDDAILWGYYLGGFNDLTGVGVGAATTYWAGYFVPGDGVLKGASINGVNLPIWTTGNMSNVSVWISEDLNTNVVSQNVDKATLAQNSYNAVALDEPFAIPETGVYVGVKFTITRANTNGDAYPILCGAGGDPNSLIMKYGNTTWADYSNQFGSYAMQLFCSDVSLPERNAYFKSSKEAYVLPSGEASLPVVIASDATVPVTSIDYVVEINGNKTSKHLDLTTPIESGIGKTVNETISFTIPETEFGTYTANISIEKVNGEANDASEKVLTATYRVVPKIVNRKTVVEEFTGTGCGYCPRGWLGMELMKETKENFIGIAFHQYNNSDPMYVANYYPISRLGINGAPGCAMDRKLLGIDPYYGSGNSIIDDFDNCSSIYPDVDVTVSGKFNDDFTAVDITADIEYLTNGGEYTVAFVLTADDLSGTTTAWRQSNYYASNSPSGDPLMDQFCKGGIYGTSYVYLTFNDVMIGSSYNNSGANLAPALTEEAKVGVTETTSYTVSMPTKTTLKEAIDNNKVYAVVLVIAKDGTIANAGKAKVTGEGLDTGIKNSVVTNQQEVTRFNVAGQQLSAPQKGLNIIKHADGKTSKVIVK